jgi:1-phosphofructokinase family hexose kinase
MSDLPRVRSFVGVALNAAIDRIVVVDRLEPGAIHRPAILSAVPGGKAANAARAAATLGLPARVVAVIGGHAGAWYEESLAQVGVDMTAVVVDGETRTCLSVLDRSTGELTEFYDPGLTVPGEAWPQLEQRLLEALADEPESSVVLLAGSLPPGVPDDAYRRLGAICAERGAAWVLDIGGPPLRAALEAGPWLVKVNEREATETAGLTPGAANAAGEAATWLRARGAASALVTQGRAGAVLLTDEGIWRFGPPPVTGPFSVGSGDALVAGLAVALAGGARLPESVRYGSAVAAANALIAGQGVFDAGRVPEILDGIAMERDPGITTGANAASG